MIRNMAGNEGKQHPGNQTTDPTHSQKAQDFYNFFRSGNHNEMQEHLVQLARNDTLDKSDLALLALMLTNITDMPARRLLLSDEQCRHAFQTILDTVRRTEASHNSKPCDHDVMEIENYISSSPPNEQEFF